MSELLQPAAVGRSRGIRRLLPWAGFAAIFTAIAVGLYVFGTANTPDPTASLFGQTGTGTLSLKSWLATGVLGLAAVQLCLALWIYGRLPGVAAAGIRVVNTHRLVGAAAMLVRSRRFPGWALPVAGGTLVVAVAALWYTSALWYFDNFRLPSL